MHREKPEVVVSSSPQEDARKIGALLAELAGDRVESRQVCVTARTNDDMGIVDTLRKLDLPYLRLDRVTHHDPTLPGVRLAATHRIKGLEFSAVVMTSYQGASRYADQFAKSEDVGVAEEMETAERCLVHVAATRAKRYLLVLRQSAE